MNYLIHTKTRLSGKNTLSWQLLAAPLAPEIHASVTLHLHPHMTTDAQQPATKLQYSKNPDQKRT